MRTTLNDQMVDFIKSFLLIFKAEISDIFIHEDKIDGHILWKDDDEDDEKIRFSWDKVFDSDLLVDCSNLCKYLITNSFLIGDKINISEEILIENLQNIGWNLTNAKRAITYLCFLDIRIYDEGVEMNSLFIHF
jgi:hypothetical protein